MLYFMYVNQIKLSYKDTHVMDGFLIRTYKDKDEKPPLRVNKNLVDESLPDGHHLKFKARYNSRYESFKSGCKFRFIILSCNVVRIFEKLKFGIIEFSKFESRKLKYSI